jgi:TPR repeat protein
VAARREAGRRYLTGADGFPRHVITGIEYLSRPNVAGHPDTARIIAESLALEEIVSWRQEDALCRAAAAGVPDAQLKYGTWLCVRHSRLSEGAHWLSEAARSGSPGAKRAMRTLQGVLDASSLPTFLRALGSTGEIELLQPTLTALRLALDERDLTALIRTLRVALSLDSRVSGEVAEAMAAAVALAEEVGEPLCGFDPEVIEECLDLRVGCGDRVATYALGRALCGIPCGVQEPRDLVAGFNVRKGAALLLRAADGGCESAWLDLYRVLSDSRCSVANPQMARFCLEKAALAGQTEAQRRLGVLVMRRSTSLRESEAAIQWLHRAARANDPHASRLLQSLVLPTAGNDEDASAAIGIIRSRDPMLAARLELARHFGLTKAEALSVDPAEGRRPWGLVVGPNPFMSKVRLSAGRAIPALSDSALDALQRAAVTFAELSREAVGHEGDLRRRSERQRRTFTRLGLREDAFFVRATASKLETLRTGTKWADKVKSSLSQALR